MKKVLAYYMFFAVAATVLTAGCQATPEQPVVIQKDMEQMIEKGLAESGTPEASAGTSYAKLCAHYGVPERFETSIEQGALAITGDVAFDLPEAAQMPMARVEAGKFSQETVTALFNALCGDTSMYNYPQQWDKTYFQQQIIDIQADLATETDSNTIKFLNQSLENMEKAYATAPETIELIPADGTLLTMDVKSDETDAASGTKTYLDATADPRDTGNTVMTFSVGNDIDYTNTDSYSYEDENGNLVVIAPQSGSRLSFMREGTRSTMGRGSGEALADVTALSLTDGAANGCLLNTTPRQARETVEALLDAAGLADMAIDRIELYTSAEKQMSDEMIKMLEEDGANMENQRSDTTETQAYVVRLLRRVNGVAVESTHDYSETNMDGVAYGREWWYEIMTVAVDDAGIANMFWTGPLDIIEVLTENTALKPWPDIQSVFEKMMPVQYSYFIDYDTDVSIDITRVRLCLQRIMEKDSFDTGLLVPVWNFYGTTTMSKQVSSDGEGIPYVEDRGYRPLLSINAIDGSMIDVDQGY